MSCQKNKKFNSLEVIIAVFICVFLCSCSRLCLKYKSFSCDPVSMENLPVYKKLIVCQGPALLKYDQQIIRCMVRCYDSNNDENMYDVNEAGVDIIEYFKRKKNNVKMSNYINNEKILYAIIVDSNYDGIANILYLKDSSENKKEKLMYKKININNASLIMNEVSLSFFDVNAIQKRHP